MASRACQEKLNGGRVSPLDQQYGNNVCGPKGVPIGHPHCRIDRLSYIERFEKKKFNRLVCSGLSWITRLLLFFVDGIFIDTTWYCWDGCWTISTRWEWPNPVGFINLISRHCTISSTLDHKSADKLRKMSKRTLLDGMPYRFCYVQ